MTYHRVNPVVWDDDAFIDLDDAARNLWFLLMTGPQVMSLPGLQRGSATTLADTSRRAPEGIAKGLASLAQRGLVLVDERHRVICLPRAPKHNPAESPNHLRSWWKKWQEIPECELKYRHISALREYADLGKPSHAEVWNQTFGRVPEALPKPSRSPPEALGDTSSIPSSHADVNADANADAKESSPDKPGSDGSLFPDDKTPKPKPRRKAPDPTPLPFTIAELEASLSSTARERVALKPFASQLATPMTTVIRALGESGVTLEQVKLFGHWLGAGGLSWMHDPIGWSWLAGSGKLASEIPKAIAWDKAGRPPVIRANGKPAQMGQDYSEQSEDFFEAEIKRKAEECNPAYGRGANGS